MPTTIVDRLDQLLTATGQPKNPLRPDQVRDLEADLARVTDQAAAGTRAYNRGTAESQRHRQRLERTLREQAAHRIEAPAERDEVARLARAVLDEVIRPTMLPQEIMQRNPPGAVDRHVKGEASRPVKRAILEWKRALRALEPENDDRAYTNLERFRPSLAAAGQPATFMADAQLPGVFGMSPQAKANWPLGAAAVRTALDGAEYQPADAAPPEPAATVTGVCQYRKCGVSFAYAPLPNGKPKVFCSEKHGQYERSARSQDKAKARAARPPAAAPAEA